MATGLFLIYFLFTLIVLAYAFNPIVWEIGSVVYLITATFFIGMPLLCAIVLWFFVSAAILIVQVESVRLFLANLFYKKAVKSIPKLSKTEEEALNAGDTWLEQDLFVGKPDWARLAKSNTELTDEEQSFLANETHTLCSLLDEWTIAQEHDLPPAVWDYIKTQGFFGLVIPKAFGGKGFSARAHSEIVLKIASRSGVAAVTVMVPNSLGPGELINYYGTQEQKEYYLPRLAKGIEIPCFALTEPEAGSDATSIQSDAIVVQKQIDGNTVLGLEVTIDKRWITLAPVATLIGLAVNLKDPEGLLQGRGHEGITCLLIPRETEGLEIGNRHLPANQPFMNGTVRGKALFVPLTTIIGGQDKAGSGWQMLVECLSIGRSISLPALGASSSAVAYLTTGAFARIRRQFNAELLQFEGVAEKLAEIAGLNYMINATRLLTVAAVNDHKKPSVASAITKYFNTELARVVLNSAMDVHAGRAVVVGPRNYLANFYAGIPISITVEGANIMSRNLLIFGQGSMACHPFIREEFYAIAKGDKEAFRRLIWGHIAYFFQNMAKAILSAWTGSLFIAAPDHPMKKACKRLTSLSQAFAWLADLALLALGGELKRKERLSARLADSLSYLYMAMAVLRQVQTQPNDNSEQLHAQWALDYCFYHAQAAMLSFCRNFPVKGLGWLMRLVVFPFGQTMKYPSDKLDSALALAMTGNNSYRERLKQMIYLSGDSQQPIDKVENALQLLITHNDLIRKIPDLRRFKGLEWKEKLQEKVAKGELTVEEQNHLLAIEEARWDAVLVDEFRFDAMKKKTFSSVIESVKSPLQ
ncbi:MAG: acyl-CoA dehydrogenase [Legionella sp.]|nr:MAG: acyl-CoA dehydrogenase [Legionella sp.]PJE00136.1 MAG: acyl-CoA dehydrogenase [Legionella sp.]